MSENKADYKPEFSSQLGFLYPLVWRILSLNRFFSISMWLPKSSGLAIDIYILVCWIIEAIIISTYALANSFNNTLLLVFVIILVYRLIDVYFALLSIFLKSYYRRAGTWLSAKRIVLLSLFNAIEVMVIFGFIYHSCSSLFPNYWQYKPKFFNLWDAIYYSFVTGTTLGYGDICPVGIASRFAAIVETSFILLVVLNLISFARGNITNPIDLESHDEKTK